MTEICPVRWTAGALGAASALMYCAAGAADSGPPHRNPGVGIVWVGGTGSEPIGEVTPRSVNGILKGLYGASYKVVTPDMCWSNFRQFDRKFDDCLYDIDYAVQKFRFTRIKRIFIVGEEFGANAAIAYGATHPDLAGIVAYLPRLDPSKAANDDLIAASLKRAERQISAGNGNSIGWYTYCFDNVRGANCGDIPITPNIYVSFFGAASNANMPKNAAKLIMPLLWIENTFAYSDDDSLTVPRGKGYAYDKAPQNPNSAFYTIDAAGTEGEEKVVEWIKKIGG